MEVIAPESVALQRFGSSGAMLHHPVSAPGTPFVTDGPARVVIAVLEQGGVIGRHPAVGEQLLLVTAGDVQVSGADGRWRDLPVGHAVRWSDGESHETRALTAATLAILEWHD